MRVSDDVLREIIAREYGGYAYPDEVEAMARELLLARVVIEAVRRHAHPGCCVSTWQDAAEAMREYDASQEGKP